MNLIVNADLDWGIGRDGQLLVHLREDMRHFKALTTGHVLVLGRKTLGTFPGGKPLPARTNIIMTRDRSMDVDGALICHSLAELAVRLAAYPSENIFVAGGDSLYHQLLPFCHQAYVTRVLHHLLADTHFPNLDRNPAWNLRDTGPVQTGLSTLGGQQEEIKFQFCLYRQENAADLTEWLRERGEQFDEED